MSNYDENITIEYKAKKYKINRYDSIYKEIETFKDYEFTNCVAYEMAIRNENLKQELLMFQKKNKSFFSKEESEKIKEIKEKYFLNIIDYLEFVNPEYINFLKYKFPTKDKVITRNTLTAFEKSNSPVINKIKTKNNNSFFAISIDDSKNEIFNHFSIFKIQARPNMFVPDNFKIQTPNFNLAFPLEELIAQITLYKKEYDRENSLLEFFKDLKKDSNNKNKISRNIKIADKFFIYDAKKAGLKNVEICDSINAYYFSKNYKHTHFDNKTLNNYLSFMEKCIDDLEYKKLISIL